MGLDFRSQDLWMRKSSDNMKKQIQQLTKDNIQLFQQNQTLKEQLNQHQQQTQQSLLQKTILRIRSSPSQFGHMTGLSIHEFDTLYQLCAPKLIQLNQSGEERVIVSNNQPMLSDQDQLFLTLYWL